MKNTHKVLLTNPVELEVTHIKVAKELPAARLAFAFPHDDAFRAVVVDMTTWGVHSMVDGSRQELAERFAREDGTVGILFMVGPGPMSDIVVGSGPRGPIGGGGPRGWPPPVLLSIVQAVSRLGAEVKR